MRVIETGVHELTTGTSTVGGSKGSSPAHRLFTSRRPTSRTPFLHPLHAWQRQTRGRGVEESQAKKASREAGGASQRVSLPLCRHTSRAPQKSRAERGQGRGHGAHLLDLVVVTCASAGPQRSPGSAAGRCPPGESMSCRVSPSFSYIFITMLAMSSRVGCLHTQPRTARPASLGKPLSATKDYAARGSREGVCFLGIL